MTITTLAIALLLLALAVWTVIAFNRLVRLRNQVRTAWADIDVQLQRRHDLVPQLVAAVRGVDYVIVFADQNVERLLLLLKPDVHCKGTDYTVDTVPERAVVRAYGGRIAIVGDPKNHSTRDLLSRISRD